MSSVSKLNDEDDVKDYIPKSTSIHSVASESFGHEDLARPVTSPPTLTDLLFRRNKFKPDDPDAIATEVGSYLNFSFLY